jgi:hypothetical protein
MVIDDDVTMENKEIIEMLRKKFARVSGVLDERRRRRRWGMGGRVW